MPDVQETPGGLFLEKLGRAVTVEVLLPSFTLEALIDLSRASKSLYALAFTELFRRKDIVSVQAQNIALSNWLQSPDKTSWRLKQEDIVNSYHNNVGNYVMQSKLILYALINYPEQGQILASDFVLLLADFVKYFTSCSIAQQNFDKAVAQPDNYNRAVVTLVEALTDRKIRLAKRAIDALKNTLVLLADASSKTIIMRYLCFYYGIEATSASEKIQKHVSVLQDLTDHPDNFDSYISGLERLQQGMERPLRGLGVEELRCLKRKIDRYLSQSTDQSPQNLKPVIKGMRMLIFMASSGLLKELFKDEQAVLLDRPIDSENFNQDVKFDYACLMIDLLPNLNESNYQTVVEKLSTYWVDLNQVFLGERLGLWACFDFVHAAIKPINVRERLSDIDEIINQHYLEYVQSVVEYYELPAEDNAFLINLYKLFYRNVYLRKISSLTPDSLIESNFKELTEQYLKLHTAFSHKPELFTAIDRGLPGDLSFANCLTLSNLTYQPLSLSSKTKKRLMTCLLTFYVENDIKSLREELRNSIYLLLISHSFVEMQQYEDKTKQTIYEIIKLHAFTQKGSTLPKQYKDITDPSLIRWFGTEAALEASLRDKLPQSESTVEIELDMGMLNPLHLQNSLFIIAGSARLYQRFCQHIRAPFLAAHDKA